MTILLSNIYTALELDQISKEQALYLIFTHENLKYPIAPKELLHLTQLKFIVGNKVGRCLLETESSSKKLTGTIPARYDSEISKEVTKKLCRLLCEVDKEGKLYLPGGEDSIEHTAENYLRGEGLIAYHYIIFLYLFPTVGDNNKRWEKHFTKTQYNGARLRIRNANNSKIFLRIAKKVDMGAFLYGTYLFIQASLDGKKTYIKSINNYLAEYQEWYLDAQDKIKKAKSVEDLFRANKNSDNVVNIVL
jgi:hypothetical protein